MGGGFVLRLSIYVIRWEQARQKHLDSTKQLAADLAKTKVKE